MDLRTGTPAAQLRLILVCQMMLPLVTHVLTREYQSCNWLDHRTACTGHLVLAEGTDRQLQDISQGMVLMMCAFACGSTFLSKQLLENPVALSEGDERTLCKQISAA